MLKEMGYSESDSRYALAVTSNNLEHACTFLMNNPNPNPMGNMMSQPNVASFSIQSSSSNRPQNPP